MNETLIARILEEEVEEEFTYVCQDPENGLTCAEECIGLEDCLTCQCAVLVVDAGGPWGEVMDVIFCLLPIIFLIVVTVKKNPMPTTRSLPTSAFLMFLVRLMYLGSDPLLTCASVVLGLHEALTPLSIMAGAITLFETMEATKCLPYMMREMKALTAGHPIAELMLIFCFAYMIEGASGFGTPVALGAPMLVSTGHDPLQAVVVLLIMNTFATVWGAVGTPIWFGFAGLTTEEGFIEISYKAAIALCIGSIILMPFVLSIIVPRELVKKNMVFIMASLVTVLGPSVGIAFGSFEFPSLMGGLLGCAGTAVLIRFKLGLSELESQLINGKDVMEIGSVSEHSIVKRYDSLSSRSELASSSRRALPTGNPEAPLDLVTEETGGDDKKVKFSVTTLAEGRQPSEGRTELKQIESVEESADDHHKEAIISEDNIEEVNSPNNASSGDNEDDGDEDPAVTRTSIKTASAISAGDVGVVSLQSMVDDELGPRKEFGIAYLSELIGRTFPIWAVVLLLILTRVSQIGLKPYLTMKEPSFSIYFGTYGTFRLSASLVFQLTNILTYPGLNWRYEFLYVPFFMPFLLISIVTMVIFRKDMKKDYGPKQIVSTVAGRLVNPAFALLGALSLVQLLLQTDTVAPSWILGNVLARWLKGAFIAFSPLLGALGSFFSGSTTVSNLTFGSIQVIAANSIGTSETTMLALQVVGASAGNGICLNNIIAACAVVGLSHVGEGEILTRTYKFVLANTTIATLVMLAFFFRFG